MSQEFSDYCFAPKIFPREKNTFKVKSWFWRQTIVFNVTLCGLISLNILYHYLVSKYLSPLLWNSLNFHEFFIDFTEKNRRFIDFESTLNDATLSKICKGEWAKRAGTGKMAASAHFWRSWGRAAGTGW